MMRIFFLVTTMFFLLTVVHGKPKGQLNFKVRRGEPDVSEGVAAVHPLSGGESFKKKACLRPHNSRPFQDRTCKEGIMCVDSDCECRPCKDCRSSSIAIKAAQEAKEAQEAQQIAGAQAAHQVKAQLAEKAEQAAKAAEAALMGKLILVDQLEHEVREAEAVVQEEAASCQRTQMNLQISLAAACQAARLLKSLTCALQLSQSTLANSQQAAEGAQQELAEKAALLDAAKCRVEALLQELCIARQDLAAIKQAACKAQTAARNASCCAQRNRRSHRARKQINNLLGRVIRTNRILREKIGSSNIDG